MKLIKNKSVIYFSFAANIFFVLMLTMSYNKVKPYKTKPVVVIKDTIFHYNSDSVKASYEFKNGCLKEVMLKYSDKSVQQLKFYESGLLKSYSKNEKMGIINNIQMYNSESISVDSYGQINSVVLSDNIKQILCLFRTQGKYYDLTTESNESVVYDSIQSKINILPIAQDVNK